MTEKYGSVLQSFQVRAEFLSERMATMETSYEQSESDAQSNISHKFVVELASPAEKKSLPYPLVNCSSIDFCYGFLCHNFIIVCRKNKRAKSKL